MDKFVIRGGNPLVGTIRVSGAKNSALPCMAAAILTEDEVTLENIPQVRDIETERRFARFDGRRSRAARRRAEGPNHHLLPHALRSRRALRNRQDHARQLSGAGPADRSRGRGPRGYARRPAQSVAGPSTCTSKAWK
ncbi:MAG: hypothetical protein WDM87_00140 [Terracidiphilus sp.]